jgi:hypothetical protein
MSWPTTRRHPRTLTEAFDDAERASWREGWQRQHALLVADVALAVAIGVALALVIVHWIDWSLA